MEKKLMEKKAIIEVLESMTGSCKWDLESRREQIERHSASIEEDKANGVEISPDDWRYSAIRTCQAYLDAYDTVVRYLEKLV